MRATAALYLVEHDLPGLPPAQLASVHRAPAEAVRRGSQIRYVQRIDVPAEHRCLCLFEATGPELVRNVNDIAQVPAGTRCAGVQLRAGRRQPDGWS